MGKGAGLGVYSRHWAEHFKALAKAYRRALQGLPNFITGME